MDGDPTHSWELMGTRRADQILVFRCTDCKMWADEIMVARLEG
jgi:hypothetical protein